MPDSEITPQTPENNPIVAALAELGIRDPDTEYINLKTIMWRLDVAFTRLEETGRLVPSVNPLLP